MANKQMKVSTIKLTQLSILMALIAVLTFTPLGFIIIPPVSMTIIHIPVIVGAILLGPKAGGVLGFAFGLMSMIRASTTGNAGDILFSPFASGSPVQSIIMCILPRILLGVIVGVVFRLLSRYDNKSIWSIPVTAVIGTVSHTLMVLGCLWGLFNQFALKEVFLAIFTVNGALEITSALIVATAVCRPLLKINSRYAASSSKSKAPIDVKAEMAMTSQ